MSRCCRFAVAGLQVARLLLWTGSDSLPLKTRYPTSFTNLLPPVTMSLCRLQSPIVATSARVLARRAVVRARCVSTAAQVRATNSPCFLAHCFLLSFVLRRARDTSRPRTTSPPHPKHPPPRAPSRSESNTSWACTHDRRSCSHTVAAAGYGTPRTASISTLAQGSR